MIYSAEQVKDARGPETPGCDCPGCKTLVALKALICAPVTQHEAAERAQRTHPGDDPPRAAWLGVLMIAAARARAQGFSDDILSSVISQGVTQAELLNPHLHYTANSKDMPL